MAKLTTIHTSDLTNVHGGDASGDAARNAGRTLAQSGRDIRDQLHEGARDFKKGNWGGALVHDLRATYDVAAAGPKLLSALWPK